VAVFVPLALACVKGTDCGDSQSWWGLVIGLVVAVGVVGLLLTLPRR
jgi:hypothetical protein